MKTMIRKLIAGSLALLLCLSPLVAQAQSMLSERLGAAFEAGRTIEVAVGLDLDDSLGTFGFMTPEDFGAAQELLRATTLRFTATQADVDRLEVGFELRVQEMPLADGLVWLAGDKLAITTSLLPGKTLLMDATELAEGFQGSMEQLAGFSDDLQVIGTNAEKYLAILTEWWESTEGLVTVSEEGTPAIPWRDASVQSYTVRVTADELKGLLLTLAEELSRDEALMALLALEEAPLDMVQALAPTDSATEWTFYIDAQGGLAGVGGAIPTLFGDGAKEGLFAYQHFTANSVEIPLRDSSLERHSFSGQLREEGVGTSSFWIELATDPNDLKAPKGSVNVTLRQAGEMSTTTMALDHAYMAALSAEREMLESKTNIDVQIQANTSGSADPAEILSGLGDTTTFSAALDFTSETRAQGQDDFICESALGLNLMEIPLGRVLVTLSSGAYVPTDTAGYETVELESLDEAGQTALLEELNAGLEQALASALAVLPPELLQLFGMM